MTSVLEKWNNGTAENTWAVGIVTLMTPGGPHHWVIHKAKLSYQSRQISLGDADWTLGSVLF